MKAGFYLQTPFFVAPLSEEERNKRYVLEEKQVKAIEIDGMNTAIFFYEDGTHRCYDISHCRVLITAEEPEKT